jgi:hypothetical protein
VEVIFTVHFFLFRIVLDVNQDDFQPRATLAARANKIATFKLKSSIALTAKVFADLSELVCHFGFNLNSSDVCDSAELLGLSTAHSG